MTVNNVSRPRVFVALPPSLYALLFDTECDERLRRHAEVEFQTTEEKLTKSELVARLASVDVLVTGWKSPAIDAEVLVSAPRLGLIVHSAGSIRAWVDRETLRDGRVRVSHAAAGMAEAVAEMAVTTTLMILRHTHHFDRALYGECSWSTARDVGLGTELSAQRVGVVGASRSGRAFIAMIRALGCRRISVFDPYLTDEEANELGVARGDLGDLLSSSDVVALHAPVTTETRHMVGAPELGLMPDGAILINTARSALVDQVALEKELRDGRIRAGLDVFDDEPLPEDHPFFGLPNVVLTPHQAGGTVQARWRQGRIVVDEVERYCAGGPLEHEVTYELYPILA